MGTRLVFLAPPHAKPGFGSTIVDSKRRRNLLAKSSRLRGSIYLADGAITAEELDENGCFVHPLDESSWHVIMIDDAEEVCGTLRISELPIDSGKRKGALPHIGQSLARGAADPLLPRLAAERFLSWLPVKHGLGRPKFFIVGGWAADRSTGVGHAGAELALSVWAFCRHTDGAGALCIATERHDAHGQLVRTGAVPIRAIGKKEMYFDAAYGCKVGLLGFSVYEERRALRRVVDHLAAKILTAEVVLGE